jgi:valyl-tRNA synthetase
MSKSKGNVVNPLDLTAKYGTDALRMALIVGNTPGSDLALAENKIKAYKLFANKLWNMSRFVLSSMDTVVPTPNTSLAEGDHKLISEFEATAQEITEHMDNYRFHMAAEQIYHYVWNTFADKIIEENKARLLENPDTNDMRSAQLMLMTLLARSLTLLHPFMPFVTEEIWGSLPKENTNNALLIITPWKTP